MAGQEAAGMAPPAGAVPLSPPVQFSAVTATKPWVVRRHPVAGIAEASAINARSGGKSRVGIGGGSSGLSSGGGSASGQGTTTSSTAPAPTATTAAPTTTAPPPPTTTAPTSLNSEARIEYCMAGPHEGPLHGVPAYWSWGSHPEVDNPSNGQYAAMTAWGQVYADANAVEPSSGVRVEVKNMEAYVWSLSQGKWVRTQGTVQVGGAHYYEDFSGNASIAPDFLTEPDGGTSTSMVTGYNFHFWPSSGRGSVAPNDIGAVYTTYQARLIGSNAGAAKYLANAGGDWWTDLTAPYPNNEQVGEGRFVYLSTSWTAVDFYSGGPYGSGVTGAWTAAQLAASHPPIDAMGMP